MAITSISDIQSHIPFLYNYALPQAILKHRFVRSGIVGTDALVRQAVQGSGAMGRMVAMPFWNDLSGDDEEMTEGQDVGVGNINSDQDYAAIHRRQKGFGRTDLSAALAGAQNDPLGAIAALLADYIVGQRQRMLFASLKGVFADNVANDDGDLVLDITSETGDAAFLSKWTLLDAAQLLGMHKGRLTAIACHSAVETQLNKIGGDSQVYKPADERAGTLASYNGKSIVVDDECAFNPSTGVAEILLFAPGAIAMEMALGNEPPLEIDRDAKKSQTVLIERDFYVMHPRGIKWTNASVSGATPTISEVENAANWDRVYRKADMRFCKLICKIPTA